MSRVVDTDGPRRPRLGVVLGGSGVRGLGQSGALGVLERARLQPDVVVGVSTGAIVAATYAARTDWEDALRAADRSWLPALADEDVDAEILVRLRAIFRNARQLAPSVWTWGRQGYEGQARTALTELLGDAAFDTLRVPLALVATDLTAADRMVLRDGKLAAAVLAASALPGVTDPIVREERLLLDGTFSDPAPVDVARDLGADVVVAVHVERQLEEPQLDSWLRALIRGMDLGTRAFAIERLSDADLVIRSELDEPVRTLDFSAIDAVARRVAVATRAAIADVRQLLADWEPGR